MEQKFTKLQTILNQRRIGQVELKNMIIAKYPEAKINLPLINRIITGKQKNFEIKTALRITKTLNIAVDDIIDESILITLN